MNPSVKRGSIFGRPDSALSEASGIGLAAASDRTIKGGALLQVGHISACGRVLYRSVRYDQLVVDALVVVSAMITSSIAARG